MRVQVMPLTPVTIDDYTTTPFVLVIDKINDHERITNEEVEHLKNSLDAQAVWVSESPLDVGGPLVLTQEQQDALTNAVYASTTRGAQESD